MYWKNLEYEIPPCMCNIYQNIEDFRVLRERTLLLIRNYNRSDTDTHTHTQKRRINVHVINTE